MSQEQNNNQKNQEQDLNQLLKVRREKLAALQEAGKDPFQITKYDQTHHTVDAKELYEAHEAKLLAGRTEPSVEGLDEQQTREVLNADYIRTARAKGLSEKPVIYKHAFRNTMIPLVTMFAGILPSLFGGMMITEQVFGIDGIGRLAYQALRDGDIPFVMGYNMFLAILTIIGTLLSDIMYSVVDPRVTLGK